MSSRRNFIKLTGSTMAAMAWILIIGHAKKNIMLSTYPLSTNYPFSMVRKDILEYCKSLQDKEGAYGSFRSALKARPDLYSSLDVAHKCSKPLG